MKPLFTIFIFLLCSTAIWSQTGNHPRILESAGNAPVRKEAVSRKDVPPGNTDSSLLSIRKDSMKVSEMVKDKAMLQQLDQYIANAIARKAMPGCQVVAIKDGVLILNKSYGTYNFDEKFPVNNLSLYDIASVTKIAATTLAVMKLYEEGKIMLQGNLMAYLPMVKGTDKATIRISDLLTHQAGLKSWIPFYKYTLDEQTKQPMKSFYSKDSNTVYPIPVAYKLFAHEKLVDTIWDRILTSPLENKGRYVYSDLDLLFLEQVIEQVTGMPLDMYVQRFFLQTDGSEEYDVQSLEAGLTKQVRPYGKR
ncbi:MAG: beta-lactamase family protein [Taibaiella sp.]|nr:beta-lactamase family protein [Taibaiella sp.]